MIFPRKFSLLTLIILIILTISPQAQIVFHELPGYKMNIADSSFFGTNQYRKIIPLNGAWQVYKANDPDKKKITVYIP
jgi:hypothetical protein